MAVGYAIVDDPCGIRVELTGSLDSRDVAPLRLRLLKCLAEQPDALLVDLSGMSVAEPIALAVFLTVWRQARRWPGIPFLLCAAQVSTRDAMAGVLRRVPVYATTELARRHAVQDGTSVPVIGDELLPVSGAPRHARNVATDACLRWELPHLIGPASLVVSELVSNVVDHAGTMATLQFGLQRRYLMISVRDGSAAKPVQLTAATTGLATHGRGLVLVGAVASSWGWLPTDGGKVVWATLSRQER